MWMTYVDVEIPQFPCNFIYVLCIYNHALCLCLRIAAKLHLKWIALAWQIHSFASVCIFWMILYLLVHSEMDVKCVSLAGGHAEKLRSNSLALSLVSWIFISSLLGQIVFLVMSFSRVHAPVFLISWLPSPPSKRRNAGACFPNLGRREVPVEHRTDWQGSVQEWLRGSLFASDSRCWQLWFGLRHRPEKNRN